MTVLQFRRYRVVDEIIKTIKDDDGDELVEALVVGKKRSGNHFSFMTNTENIPELIGFLEVIKSYLTQEMISQAEREE